MKGAKKRRGTKKMANLTTKELMGVEDQLSSEQILIAKYKMYAEATSDATLKTKFNSIASQHQQHFDKLFSLLG